MNSKNKIKISQNENLLTTCDAAGGGKRQRGGRTAPFLQASYPSRSGGPPSTRHGFLARVGGVAMSTKWGGRVLRSFTVS